MFDLLIMFFLAEEENSYLIPIIVGTLLVAVAIIVTIVLVYIFVVRKKGKQ